MTGSRGEDAFLGAGAPPEPAPPRRRESPLLRRSPLLAAVVVAMCGWLLTVLWPDVAYFFSPGDPIALGGPGAYRLDAARENRLAQIEGRLVDRVPVTETRTGAARTVGRIAGTNLVVDRPGAAGPDVYEGRLLPATARAEYGGVVAAMQARGATLGDRFLVLRDGERPRKRWPPVAGAVILLALVAVNGRALARHLLRNDSQPRASR